MTLPGERLIALGRSIVGDTRNVFYAPSIPETKLKRLAPPADHLARR